MSPSTQPELLAFSRFHLDLARGLLRNGQDEIKLRPKAYALLRYLAERPRRLVSKNELMEALWGDVHVGEAVLKTHLYELRQALRDDVRAPAFIETVHRRGYRFIAPVSEVASSGAASQAHFALAQRPPDSILVGRDAELELLSDLFEESLLGRSRLVFITGEAGIGKTSLVRTFADRVAARPQQLMALGQCIEHHGAGEAYLPVFDAFSKLSRQVGGSHLFELLRRYAPDWKTRLSALTDSAEGSFRRNTTEPVLYEVAVAIRQLAQAAPILLILEDLHWADYSTIALIEYLTRSEESARMMLIGTYRPQELGLSQHPLRALEQRLDAHRQCRTVALDYLGQNDVSSYLEARFANHQFPADLAAAVQSHTSGNPLFVARVLDSLVTQQLVHEDHGFWCLEGPVSAVRREVPDSVTSLIERDIERLDASEWGILEAASVAGIQFSARAVAAALDQPALLVEDVCVNWSRQERFIKRGLTNAPSSLAADDYEFLHAIYQQVVYARIGPIRRALLHQRLGDWLAQHATTRSASAASLALHFERGQDPVRAIGYRRLAAEQAMRRGAYREALDHYQGGMPLLNQVADSDTRARAELELLLGLAVPLARTRGYTAPETQLAYARAEELSKKRTLSDLSVGALAGLAACKFVAGAYVDAERAGQEMLGVARRQNHVGAEISGRLIIGVSHFCRGRLKDAADDLKRSLELCDPRWHAVLAVTSINDPVVTARSFLALTYWHFGQSQGALGEISAALALAEELGDPFSMGCALSYSVLLQLSRRDMQASQRVAQELLVLATKHHFEFYLSTAHYALGAAEVASGSHSTGLEQLRRARRDRDAARAGINGSFWLATLAEAYMQAGKFDDAARSLAEAVHAVDSHGERFWEAELYRIAGELLEMNVPLGRWPGREPPVTSTAAFLSAISAAESIGSVALARRAHLRLEGKPDE
jgi:DNA-binding winged helix-turn-helix (wHTH) protein/tetratricopeptide (TPR) repeat protein